MKKNLKKQINGVLKLMEIGDSLGLKSEEDLLGFVASNNEIIPPLIKSGWVFYLTILTFIDPNMEAKACFANTIIALTI